MSEERLRKSMIEAGYVHPDGHRYEHQANVYAFAQALSKAEGNNGDRNALDRWQRNLYRWLEGGAMNPDKAEFVAHVLGKPADFFKTETQIREIVEENRALAQELEELREMPARLDRIEAAVERLSDLLIAQDED